MAQIVDVLRCEIVSGKLPPGEPLRQEHLVRRFGLSRIPVREAITHLHLLGFTTIEPDKRARVSSVSRADFLGIYDMRIAIETLALKSAMPQLNNAQIGQTSAPQA